MHLSSGRKSKIRGKILWRGSYHLPSDNGRLWAANTPQPAWLCSHTASCHHRGFFWNPSQARVPRAGPTHIPWDAFHWKAIAPGMCLHRLPHRTEHEPVCAWKETAHWLLQNPFFSRNNTSLCCFSLAWHIEQGRSRKYWHWRGACCDRCEQ